MKMLGTLFYLPWTILLIKTHPFLKIFSKKIKNNPPVSNSNKKASVNRCISDSKNQFETGLTILSDPSNPLFKDDKRKNYTLSLFSVLFRLFNDDFFDSLKGKKDELANNLLKLREKVLKGHKDQESVNEITNDMVEFLEKKYRQNSQITIIYGVCSFLKYFLKYIVESNLDQDNKYFGMELKDKTVVIKPEKTKDNIILPMFHYDNLEIIRDHMSFVGKYKWGFSKKPKLIFFHWPRTQILKEKRNKHLRIQHEDKTDENKTHKNKTDKRKSVYNLKGIVFTNENLDYNSYFIIKKQFYDQKTGNKKNVTTAEIFFPYLLIYELSE
ncbi:hypothetical protein M153_2400004485 [Pseudoloma neurophilia]|uniref:Uncharacterized protein n=1 Tax=Pseudoloma neurophilia TaxID=146866 RepID=A0A0R0LZ82_9MICR|nr:hypothetical protein M153_2400004485 [Pseudoloma neurophilia]